MGLELFSPDDDTAAVVTAIAQPEGSTPTSCFATYATATASPSRPASST